jgi:hypothetical protein
MKEGSSPDSRIDSIEAQATRPLFELCAAATARFEGAGEREAYIRRLFIISHSLLYRGNVGHWSVSRYAQTGPCCGWLTTLHRGGRANVLISRGFFFCTGYFWSVVSGDARDMGGGRETQNFVPKPRFEKQTKKQIFCSSCFPRSRVEKFSTRFYHN